MDKKFMDAVRQEIKEQERVEQAIIKGAKERGWKSLSKSDLKAENDAFEKKIAAKRPSTQKESKPSRGR